MNLYYYGGEWHVASSSLPDGSGSVSKTHSVADLFWELWKNLNYTLPKYPFYPSPLFFSSPPSHYSFLSPSDLIQSLAVRPGMVNGAETEPLLSLFTLIPPRYTHYTYMFELFSPRNPVVVRPTREALVLHGVRDLRTLCELDPVPIAQEHNWEAVYVRLSLFANSFLSLLLLVPPPTHLLHLDLSV